MTYPTTFPEWQRFASALHARAAALSVAIVTRARAVATAAGLDPAYPFMHAHNAINSRAQGRPWTDVDYGKARLVLRLEQRSWEPHRIARRIIERAFERVRASEVRT